MTRKTRDKNLGSMRSSPNDLRRVVFNPARNVPKIHISENDAAEKSFKATDFIRSTSLSSPRSKPALAQARENRRGGFAEPEAAPSRERGSTCASITLLNSGEPPPIGSLSLWRKTSQGFREIALSRLTCVRTMVGNSFAGFPSMLGLLLLFLIAMTSFAAGYITRSAISRRRRANYLKLEPYIRPSRPSNPPSFLVRPDNRNSPPLQRLASGGRRGS
jgi:hypothetical protein